MRRATRRADEYLTIWRALVSGETITYRGKHMAVGGRQAALSAGADAASAAVFRRLLAAGQRVAAKHADVYLTWGEPPEDVAQKIADARALAAEQGRTLSFGIRLHVIVRETAEEAWRAADDLIKHVDDATIAKAQQAFSKFDSVGQQRMAKLHGGRRDKLVVAPNLWAGCRAGPWWCGHRPGR